jgi:taurine dioxygenase
MRWRPIAPFGVEVDCDLSRPLTDADAALLGRLLDEHGILVVPGQSLPLEVQIGIMRRFGPVLGDRATLNYVAPDDGVLGTGALGFHSDLAFAPRPFDYISLHALDVADRETSTVFAHGGRAYARLSTSLRQRLASLSAAAISSSARGRTIGYAIPASAIRFDRPAVIAHPRTGESILYVNQAQTARFNELDERESDALLQQLFDILYDPECLLEHRWSTGDLLIWDNIQLQHARPALEGVTRRRLQRVVVAERSLYEQVPDFRPGDPDPAVNDPVGNDPAVSAGAS